ncbi:hypothetical protein S40288_08100 [Stachybotrys chartarum IBT 40288]|nr:hypothetical protein S40288_08100 [Stachybotrys chartarum IBT 40288]
MTIVPLMAAVTKSIGFGLEKVSSQALGHDDIVPHDERYACDHEYMDLIYKLWESSWADDAVVWDRQKRVAYDLEKMKRIKHEGKYFKASALGSFMPSPQRTLVLFQAGTSTAGRAFASKHAEAIYFDDLVPAQTKKSIANIRADAAARGRDHRAVKFFVGTSPILGRTKDEAYEKYQRARKSADHIGGLAQFWDMLALISPDSSCMSVPGLKGLPSDHHGHKFKFGSGFEGDSIEECKENQSEALLAAKATTNGGVNGKE